MEILVSPTPRNAAVTAMLTATNTSPSAWICRYSVPPRSVAFFRGAHEGDQRFRGKVHHGRDDQRQYKGEHQCLAHDLVGLLSFPAAAKARDQRGTSRVERIEDGQHDEFGLCGQGPTLLVAHAPSWLTIIMSTMEASEVSSNP